MKDFCGCTVLITGASSGIGVALARELAAEASTLILVARREDRLMTLGTELKGRFPTLKVEIVAADLGTSTGVEWVLTQLVARGLTVDVLMNNAGLGDVGTLRTAPWERIQPMLSVNIVALTQLTQALLPGMVERGRGAILNVSSTASFLPIPSFAVYAATKAYVTSFSEALRAELTAKGVAVTALCPGPVKTEFGQVASRPDGKREFSSPGWLEVAVEDVAREAIAGLKANRALVIPGFLMKLAALGIRLTPRWIFRLMFTLNAGKM